MKKVLVTIIVVLLGITLHAQVSVWDGTAEIWTHGSGTPDDPYLIESVQNLAYIAEKTNESIYDAGEFRKMYVDTCFLVTVDLDFGADQGLEWEPIASNGANWWKGRFCGHFDGGGHRFINLTISNETANFFGIFGYMEDGSLKNIIVDGNNIHVPNVYSYGCGCVGLLLGYGNNVIIENCINRVNVFWDKINIDTAPLHLGGLFGRLANSTITACCNYGNIIAPETEEMYDGPCCGCIAGGLINCDVSDCSNYGDLYLQEGEDLLINHVYGGGIAGVMTGTIANCNNNGEIHFELANNTFDAMISTGGIIGYTATHYVDLFWGDQLTIRNCYSISNMNTFGGSNPSWAAGIMGYVGDTIPVSIENCYFVTSSMVADNIGGIIGETNENTVVNNCHYINTIESINEYGTPQSESFMKSEEFVDILNVNGLAFKMDEYNINNGYPLLERQESCPLVGSEWYYKITTIPGDITYQCLSHVADTTINHRKVKVIVKTNTLYDKDHVTNTHEYIYDEDAKVYWWNKSLEEFTVLYDFAAEVGNEWEIKVGENSITMHVEAVDNVEYNGRVFKSLTVSDADDVFGGTIVCGIGHLTSFFPERLLNDKSDYEVDGIRCCWNEGELVYKEGNEDCDAIYDALFMGIEEQGAGSCAVYPNPTSGMIRVEAENIQNVSIYNILGEKVFENEAFGDTFEYNFSSQKAGIYIIKVSLGDGTELYERIVKE